MHKFAQVCTNVQGFSQKKTDLHGFSQNITNSNIESWTHQILYLLTFQIRSNIYTPKK